MDRNLIFQHILTNIYWKNFYKFIAIPWKWVAPSMSLKSHSNARFCFDRFKNELSHLCPLNRIQTFGKNMAIPWKWTTECSNRLWTEFMDRTYELQFHFGLMDVGRYKGVAPSMWAFAAWFWRMSGSWAIYVPKRQLDVEKKIWGETSAEDCKKYVIFRDIDGSTALF